MSRLNAENAEQPKTLTVRVPLTLRKRGGRKLVIGPNGETHSQPRVHIDNAMVKAVARAFRWRDLLETGACSTIAEIAADEKVTGSYISRLLRLTLLSPAIIEAILDGRQDRTLQLDSLLKPMPVEWDEQGEAIQSNVSHC